MISSQLSPVKATMSYNDQYRERDRSSSYDDDRYPHPNYRSSRWDPSSDPRRSNSSYDRRSEIPCRFGMMCRNAVCPYRHDSLHGRPRDSSFDRRATIPCRDGMNCIRPLCPYKHESEASRSPSIPSNYSSSINSADVDRTNSNSIGRRFEPPPLIPLPVREQPPQQSLRTHSHLKQDFGKRFEPPSNPSKSQPSSEKVVQSTGERQRKLLSFIPPKISKETLDAKQSEIMQQRFVPNRTTSIDADSLAKRQQPVTSNAKSSSVVTNNTIKTDNEKCDTILEPKPMEVDMRSKPDIMGKDSSKSKQNETSDVTDNSKVESRPRLTEQQQSPQRTMAASVDSNNCKTCQDRKNDDIPKPKPVQKLVNPLPKALANSTARKSELKPNCAKKEKVRVASQSTSTLANLLSSQRRSAAQLQRYRVQQARPFEKIQSDIPIISTVPKSSSNNEILSRTHVSTKQQDDVTNVKKNLTKDMQKIDDRVHNCEKKDTLNCIKESTISKLVAKEDKAHTTGTKKRKADEIKSTVAAAADIDTAVAAKPRKKNKGVNPFRVKVGSVVSVRFRNISEGGNPGVIQVANDEQSPEDKPKLFEAWSEPIAGRHDGLSLLGCRIKCIFAKSFVEKWLEKNTNVDDGSIQNNIEGNVVSILGSDDQNDKGGIIIGLLVDREKIKSMPFLQVIPDDTFSSSKLALRRIEDKIRGETNVVVKVILASVMDKKKGVKLNRSVVKQWVVRNRVVAKPSGKKPTKSERKANNLKKQALFVGDGNDMSQQQEKNWRWIAARAIAVNSTNESNSSDVASQLVGEVTAMVVHEDPGARGSLATVTIRRMWTPEQTKTGRMGVHDHLELFDDHDGEVYFQAPVEELVVTGKSVSRQLDVSQLSSKSEERNFHITHSYNASDGTYKSLLGGVCDCRLCSLCNVEMTKVAISSPPLDTNNGNQFTTDESISSLITSMIESVNPVNFTLPNDVGSIAIRPSYLPNIGSMKSDLYSEANPVREDKKSQPRRKKKHKRKKRVTGAHDDDIHLDDEEDSVKFKPTCSRTIPFDDIMSDYWYLRNKKTTSVGARRDPSTREIARPRAIESKTKEEVTTLLTGRAARANQRRMVKSLGTASTGVDRLAGRDREHYLRFGKSTIEGWGVFAEEPINAGDLIIEYRGELIGHAVADKREREYEDANVPDYMFRIDRTTVCDATRLGNVARFINASCSPNCYTQIITANENKRIVIYAKRNIARGEELCYDYKFPIEMDPTKRIPCGCGAIECRGYMNWDKRWD